MINSIVPVQSMSDLKSGVSPTQPSADASTPGRAAEAASPTSAASTAATSDKPAAQPETKPDVRLTIEENGDHTGYVYKMVDRFTGKTIAEIPREAVSQIGASESYAAGSVVSTSA